MLDYDDTYEPGLAHLSAPVAPAALLLGAELGVSTGEALRAFAAGFEFAGRADGRQPPPAARAGLAPDGGLWRGGRGAGGRAAARARRGAHRARLRFALLQAAGLRSAFGSDGKALQVGRAAAAGAAAARLAAAGASAGADIAQGDGGFEEAYRARWVEPGAPGRRGPAAAENRIKAYPCCLQTQGRSRPRRSRASRKANAGAELVITVHPVLPARRLARPGRRRRPGGEVLDSLPHRLRAPARPAGPRELRRRRRGRSTGWPQRVTLRTDPCLRESEAVLAEGGERAGHVEAALGSPARPIDEARLRAKVRELACERLDGVLDDLDAPVARVVAAAGLG